MSGIGGVFNLDGAPVPRETLGLVAAAISHRGPDGLESWTDARAGLVHSHFWTTPEDLGKKQPLSDGACWITADARIDNRDEILPVLEHPCSSSVPSDAGLILAAYRKWGVESPKHLVGDFAFAIWDPQAQRLFCARDPVGIRPFQYARAGNTLVFASTTGAVVAAFSSRPVPNLPFMSDLLAGRYERWISETAYKDVFRLPPAHSLIADTNGISISRYWTFGQGQKEPCTTKEEYITRFRDVFREAVRCRLRSAGPVGMTVSGGLDSSSIACMIKRLIEDGMVKDLPVRMYSSVYDHTPCADERVFLDELLGACPGFPATLIPSDDLWGMKEFADDHGFPLDEPETDVIRALLLAQLQAAQGHGCRVFVSGHGGDQVMNTDAYYFPDVLNDVGLYDLIRELRHFYVYRRSAPVFFLSAFIAPHIPAMLKKRLSTLFYDPSAGGLLTPLCTKVIPGADPEEIPSGLGGNGSGRIFRAVTDGLNSAYRVTLDTYASSTGVEWRFPFYDRRLIDFMVMMPPRLTFRDGVTRCQLREAMKGMVPEKIRTRLSKAHAGDLQDRGLKSGEKDRAEALLQEPGAVRLGLVRQQPLEQAWKSYLDGTGYPARPLVRFLCAEAWLRGYEKRFGRIPGEEVNELT